MNILITMKEDTGRPQDVAAVYLLTHIQAFLMNVFSITVQTKSTPTAKKPVKKKFDWL